jgi:hypothetical protein
METTTRRNEMSAKQKLYEATDSSGWLAAYIYAADDDWAIAEAENVAHEHGQTMTLSERYPNGVTREVTKVLAGRGF